MFRLAPQISQYQGKINMYEFDTLVKPMRQADSDTPYSKAVIKSAKDYLVKGKSISQLPDISAQTRALIVATAQRYEKKNPMVKFMPGALKSFLFGHSNGGARA